MARPWRTGIDRAYRYGDREVRVSIQRAPDGWRIRLPEGGEAVVQFTAAPEEILKIIRGDRAFRVPFARTDDSIHISWGGAQYTFSPAQEGGGGSAGRTPADASREAGRLLSPMTGNVADVLVIEGQEVAAYQPVVVVEAMKVLATVEAPFAGRVARVLVARGQQVEHGAPLVELTPAAS